MTGKIEKDWFKVKRYLHIGLPIKNSDRHWVERLVKDEKKVAEHAFLPLVHRKITQRKFRRKKRADGSKSKKREVGYKSRDIHFSNQLDSNIYGYYAEKIQKKYDKHVEDLGISDCITAYRRVLHESKERNKCNVDFASDVFEYIKAKQHTDLLVLAFDVADFFPSIGHKNLKNKWKRIMNFESSLPRDHYNLFKNITQFSFIREKELFKEFKDEIIVERTVQGKNKYIKKKVKKIKYLNKQRAVAYCYKKDIHRLRSAGLIRSNKEYEDADKNLLKREKGIPQGSPISSVLANLYLVDFDLAVHEFLSKRSGIYRRYSDDMVVICDPKYENEVKEFVLNEIKQKECDLEIQESKTQAFMFKWDNKENRHYCYDNDAKTQTDFQYLGFEFDGKYTSLKSASIARFYRGMKRTMRRRSHYASTIRNNTKGVLFTRKLYKKFTYRGANRRMIWRRSRHKSDKFIRTLKYDWGNYITYTNLAQIVIPDNKIANQMKSHWRIFHKELSKYKKNKPSEPTSTDSQI